MKLADDFDIVLMRCQYSGVKLYRTFMQSEFGKYFRQFKDKFVGTSKAAKSIN